MLNRTRFALAMLALPAAFLCQNTTTALAGPNLMALSDYAAVAYHKAEGRDSASGREVIYHFDDPELDFGRVVARSQQPNSVVRRDLFVGFDGQGLMIDTRDRAGGRGSVRIDELEVWLRIQGDIRPDRRYAWEIEAAAENKAIENGYAAIVPAMWADGEPVGVKVSVRRPEQADTDRIQRMVSPHGVVRLPSFERQTGAAWVVLKPARFGAFFQVRKVSFGEVDPAEAINAETDMPVPMRYVPIRDVLEDGIAEALLRGAVALQSAHDKERHWPDEDLEGSVSLTALVVSALAELDPNAEHLDRAMQWLARQVPEDAEQTFSVQTIASRLHCLARHGGLKRFRRIIHTDIQSLAVAQFDNGGWSNKTRGDDPQSSVTDRADNVSTAMVLRSLREAKFAGAEIDTRLWRNVMRYWTEAQAFDGGYRRRLERYGGVGTATTSAFTALGAAALITSLDMAAAVHARRCNTYLASRKQLRAIDKALGWLDRRFKERFSDLPGLTTAADPFIEPLGMQWLGEVSGLARFNDRNHFAETARDLLRHFDRDTGMFGFRGGDGKWTQEPSVRRTAQAISIIGAGAAPAVCQRIIVGEDENKWVQYTGDAAHLARYIGARRGRPFTWRRTTIERDIRELAQVPILLLSVRGPFAWSPKQWDRIRAYCMAGGSVVIDIVDGQNAQRDVVTAALAEAFPEYRLKNLSADAPLFSTETRLSSPPAVQALGNGFRHFLYLPAESWSCQWHLYNLRKHEDSFALMNNLLTYTTNDTPLPSAFAPSTYPAEAVASFSMKALHLETGGEIPAYPDFVHMLDRLMRANYRLGLTDTKKPEAADLVWISVTGGAPPGDRVKSTVQQAIRHGRYLFVDVVAGREGWDETFRAVLAGMDGVTIDRLRRSDQVFSGKIPGSQGFDVAVTDFRKSLRTRFSTRGRCDLYAIRRKGERVGTYSAHDISSGIGNHYFPDCRGPMPKHAREIAMNVCLIAYSWKLRDELDQRASVTP